MDDGVLVAANEPSVIKRPGCVRVPSRQPPAGSRGHLVRSRECSVQNKKLLMLFSYVVCVCVQARVCVRACARARVCVCITSISLGMFVLVLNFFRFISSNVLRHMVGLL